MKGNFIRNRLLFILDIAFSFVSFALVVALFFPLANFVSYYGNILNIIFITTFVYVLFMALFHNYSVYWVDAGGREYLSLLLACFSSMIISLAISAAIPNQFIYFKLNFAANLCLFAAICGLRFALRLLFKISYTFSKRKGAVRVIVVGAGRLAVMLLRDLTSNDELHYDVIGLVDDDVYKKKQHIHGTKVLGNTCDLPRICREREVEEIIFAIHNIDADKKREILDICSQTGCRVKILPSMKDSLTGQVKVQKIRKVEIEDLLERDPVVLDNGLIEHEICDQVVLVTGGSGSIGSELCRQILHYKPSKLIVFDIYENTTHDLQNELEEAYPEQEFHFLIGSVRDKARLDDVFTTYRPSIVFHAAAHKHVPLMEFSPGEAVKNNVFGTYNTALAAKKHGVKRFVLISTDKAVNPTNVMGASKRMCEMIVQTLQKDSETDFVAVRFGNVLGSNGSVIPRFKKQIAAGGPVTVTHPDITRFFMTIPEAAQLVLQAASYANGGEIFVLDMGQPVKIYDLARKIITLGGLKPDVDIKIEFTGLRPGEKLYEELLMSEEGLKKTTHSKIFVGKPIDVNTEELMEKLDILEKMDYTDTEGIKQVVSEVVPTYQYKPM